MAGYKVEGAEALMRKFDGLPAQAKKAMDESFKAGGKAAVRAQKAEVGGKWPHLIKYKLHRDALNKTYIMIGYQSIKKKGMGKAIPDWFKAYWANYGTLTHRDPTHSFQRDWKRVKKGRRNNEGQRAQSFFRAGSDNVVRAFFDAQNKKAKELIEKYYKQ